jgi:glucokinase
VKAPTRFVGLDFGGTNVKGGAITEQGDVLAERSIPIHLEGGSADVLDRSAKLARDLGVADSLGVGIAGLLDRSRGVLVESPNLTQMNGVDVVGGLAGRLGLARENVSLENDAKCAALGEQWLGAGRGKQDFIVVTLGTGIGGGLVLGGKLFRGPAGNAGEIGHVVVDPSGPRCGCGALGCLETLASATAARRRAEERELPRGSPGNLELLTERAREKPGPERDLLLEIGRDLGHGLAYAVVLLDLPCFLFAGGFSAALDVMEPGIRRGLDERRFGRRPVELVRATLGAGAGWRGAARLAIDTRERE